MAASALQPLGSRFDRFLYAPVGADRHGGMLSVVSALARLGVDPWDHAAMLARLPMDSAARLLSALLAKLPAGIDEAQDPLPLATHLVSLLPREVDAGKPVPATVGYPEVGLIPRLWPGAVLVVVVVVLALGAARVLEG
jgi:hypothetical protein